MKRILIVLFWLSGLIELEAQAYQFYYTRFGGDQDDMAKSIIQSKDSGYFVIGQTTSFNAFQNDIYVAKTDKNLVPLWEKNIGGFSQDVGLSTIELNDSGLVIVGFTNSYGAGGYDAIIVRTDKLGNLIWQKTFGGLNWDFANSVKYTNDGNIIVCGTTYSFGKGNKDAFVFKMDLNGNIIWQKTFGGKNDDEFKDVIQSNDGSFLCAGYSNSYGDSLGDIWIAKLNNQGDSLWFFFKGGTKRDLANSIIQDQNGDYLVAGGSSSFTNGEEDIYLFKLSNAKTVIWERFYGMADKDEQAFCIRNANSSYGKMMVCYTTDEISGFKLDAKALLLDGSGYYIDGGRVGSNENEEVYSIANCFDKGYVLAGYTNSFNSKFKDVFVIKFDSLVHGTGTLLLSNEEQLYPINEQFFMPNPFNDYITINGDLINSIYNIAIYDLNGCLIFEAVSDENKKVRINTSYWNEGIYILKISTKTNVYFNKVFCYH